VSAAGEAGVEARLSVVGANDVDLPGRQAEGRGPELEAVDLRLARLQAERDAGIRLPGDEVRRPTSV